MSDRLCDLDRSMEEEGWMDTIAGHGEEDRRLHGLPFTLNTRQRSAAYHANAFVPDHLIDPFVARRRQLTVRAGGSTNVTLWMHGYFARRDGWRPIPGYLSAGDELFDSPPSLTVEEAEGVCGADPSCSGFSYAAFWLEHTPQARVQVHFKRFVVDASDGLPTWSGVQHAPVEENGGFRGWTSHLKPPRLLVGVVPKRVVDGVSRYLVHQLWPFESLLPRQLLSISAVSQALGHLVGRLGKKKNRSVAHGTLHNALANCSHVLELFIRQAGKATNQSGAYDNTPRHRFPGKTRRRLKVNPMGMATSACSAYNIGKECHSAFSDPDASFGASALQCGTAALTELSDIAAGFLEGGDGPGAGCMMFSYEDHQQGRAPPQCPAPGGVEGEARCRRGV